MDLVLTIRNLKTYFYTDAGTATAVDDVSFNVSKGKTVALVGESGCGKSVTALSVMRLVPEPPGRILDGQIVLDGKNVLSLNQREMRALRGNAVSMIFQEPMTSLNPVFRVGSQVAAAIRVHRDVTEPEAYARTIELFAKVGIPSPERRIHDYPHQMSGGMRQRVMIAMALACDPLLLIADEPTTALDVTIQAQILDLLRRLQTDTGMSILLITHDLGVVAEMADDVAIMYAGKIVEHAPAAALFRSPGHPYTRGLFASLPSVQRDDKRLQSIAGQVPAATHFPPGCRFHPRCPHAFETCKTREPANVPIREGHTAACWLHDAVEMETQGKPVGIPAQ